MATIIGTSGSDSTSGGTDAASIDPPSVVGGSAQSSLGASAQIGGDIDSVQLSHLLGADIVTASPTTLFLAQPGVSLTLIGTGFTFDANEQLIGGTVSSIDFSDTLSPSHPSGHIGNLSIPVGTLLQAFALNDNALAFGSIFSGDDTISGASGGPDLLRGYDGDDLIQALAGGSNSLYGGAGDDRLIAGAGADYLNGGAGADTLSGGLGSPKDTFEFGAGESPSARAVGGHVEHLDHITDWTGNDVLLFTGAAAATASNYGEFTAPSFDQAANLAQVNLNNGVDYTVVQVGADVIVLAPREGDAVVLSNTTLASISPANIGGDPTQGGPAPAASGATVDLYDGSDMGTFQESSLSDAVVTRSPTLEHLTFAGGAAQMSITGTNLTYDLSGALSGGTVTGVEVTSPAGHFVLAGAHTDGSILGQAFHNNDANLSISNLLSGNDVVTARGVTTPGADSSFTGLGYGGNDLMVGGGTFSNFDGGTGDDTLQAASAGQTYLRGNDGNDSIVGGAGFDDINGNKGADTIDGGAGPGGDWLVGGQGDDNITARAGQNLLYGNLGNDTLHGGTGGDVLRGGQGDDSIAGGSGNDFVSGDRGADTMSGGLGADIFHTSQDAGVDRVLDFSQAQGDRVQLDPGTSFTVIQVSGDTVIDLGGGNQMILVGVQMTTLTPGWIFGA